MNFKHNKDSKNLKGFEKKFYDAVVKLAMIVCDATEAKPGEVNFSYVDDDSNCLKVVVTIDTRDLKVSTEHIENYIYVLASHFPVFFTPAHYRPYNSIEVDYSSEDVNIIGMYAEGV